MVSAATLRSVRFGLPYVPQSLFLTQLESSPTDQRPCIEFASADDGTKPGAWTTYEGLLRYYAAPPQNVRAEEAIFLVAHFYSLG